MVDIAALGLSVTGTGDVNAGAAALDNLANAAGRAETAAERLKRQHDEATRAARQAASASGNLAAQFQDIAVSIQAGQLPMAIALQQGTQISAVFDQMKQNGQGAGAAIRSALQSIVSPMSLVIITTIGLTAAFTQWLSKSNEAEKLSDILKRQKDIVTDLGNAYGDAAKNAEAFATSSLANFGLRSTGSETALRLRMAADLPGSALGSEEDIFEAETYQGSRFRTAGRFIAFDAAIQRFQQTVKAGNPDIITFRREVEETWAAVGQGDTAITAAAVELLKLTDNAYQAAMALKELEIIQRRLFEQVGPNGMLLSQGTINRADMGNLALFESQQRVAAQRRQQAADAELRGIFAKSPQEIADAVRARETSIYNDAETVRERQDRISIATIQALTEAEFKLAEARRKRAEAARETIEQSQLDILLVGASAGAQAAATYRFERLIELRQEAADNNIEMNQAEVESVKRVSEEYGKLVDQLHRVKLQTDLMFEREQIFRNSDESAVAQRLKSAGLDVDMNGQLAGQIRLNQELEKMKEAWEDIRNVGMDAIDSIVDSGMEGFKDLGETVADIGKEILSELTTLAIKNPLKNAAYGTNLPTVDTVGGIGGFFASLLGGPQPGSQMVGAMNVNAATVVLSGAGLAGGDLGRIFNPANSNIPGGAGNPTDLAQSLLGLNENSSAESINSFLKRGGVDLDAAQTAWCAAFVNSSLNQLGIKGSGSNVANSFLNWGSAILDPNSVARGDVLVRPNGFGIGATGGHVGLATGLTRMGRGGLELQMLSGNTGGEGLGSGGVGLDWVNASKISIRRATEGLSTLATTSVDTAQSLAGGLGNLATNLSQFPAAPTATGGGGGLFSWLGNLFGGGGSAYSPAASAAIASGNIGLFANGGVTDRPAIFGEGWMKEAAVPLPDGRNIPVDLRMSGRSPMPDINFINNGTPQKVVEQRDEDNGQGGRRLTYVLEDAIADAVSRPGSSARRAVSTNFGVQPRVVRR